MSKAKQPQEEHSEYFRELSRNLRYYHLARKLTQQQLADRANTDVKYYSRVESETYDTNATITWVFEIARCLQIHPYKLLKPLSDIEPFADETYNETSKFKNQKLNVN